MEPSFVREKENPDVTDIDAAAAVLLLLLLLLRLPLLWRE